jgi:hypothetical protein
MLSARLALCLFVCSALLACSDPKKTKGVSTAGPDQVGDGGESGDDAGAHRSPRGEVPVYPAAKGQVVVPYRGGEETYLLRIEADLSELDLHFNVDTTGSIGDEIDNLQREIRNTIIMRVSQKVPHVSYGVSGFADFPRDPFGAPGLPPRGDRPFTLFTPVTSDTQRVGIAIAKLDNPLSHGGDDPEAGFESLYQVATGAGYVSDKATIIRPWDRIAAVGGGTLGGVGFRPLSLKVVMHVTDVYSHTPEEYAAGGYKNTHGMSEASTALQQLGARVIGIMSTHCESADCRKGAGYKRLRSELSRLAVDTRATVEPTDGMCPMGVGDTAIPPFEETCPLVFDVRADGSGLSDTASDAVLGLLDTLSFAEVHAEVDNDPLGFVTRIELAPQSQVNSVSKPKLADRLPADHPDGADDTYLNVHKRAKLGFRVVFRNDRLAPMDVDQHFRITVRVVGDGIVLEERTLRVIVPAGRITPPGSGNADAGMPAKHDAGAPDSGHAPDAQTGNDAGE